MTERMFYAYILASKKNGTLYIGVTNDIVRRVWEHKQKVVEGFTRRYSVNKLVYYECYDTIAEAMQGERRLKRYRRAWKIKLIEKANFYWEDLFEHIAAS